MNKELFIKVIEAIQHQSETEDKVSSALSVLCPENCFFSGLTDQYGSAFDAMALNIFGATWWDYIGWWLYEAPKNSRYVDIDKDRYWVESLDKFYEFLENHVKKG
jgi:hypothetical protein